MRVRKEKDMRGTALAFNRFLALLLSFLLGFLSFAGVLVGAGYLVYSQLSVDALNKLGFNIQTEEFLDPDAEQPLTSMTIQKLVEEIMTLSKISDEVDIDMLIERYGLKLDEQTNKIIPEGIRKIPLSDLFGPEGSLILLENIEVSYVLSMVPEGIISDPMIDALSDNNLKDIVDGDLAYLFDGVDLGFLVGVTYEKNEDGQYEIVYAEEGNPTFLELIAPLDLGGLLGSVAEGNLDLISVIEENFMDIEILDLIKSFAGSSEDLPAFLEGKVLGDIIIDEDGETKIDVAALLDGERIGTIIGYEHKDLTDDGIDNPVWVLKDTEDEADSITSALCDINLSDLLAEDADPMQIVMDSLGTNTLGSLMGYDLVDGKWVDANGNEADSITASLCPIELSDLISEGADPMEAIMDSLGANTLGDLMGFELVDGKWVDADGNEADSLTASLCPIELSDLISEGADPMEAIMDSLGTNTLGDLMGFELVDGKWVDADGNEADSLTASLCTIKLSDLISEDADPMDTIMDSIGENTFGDIMGYEIVDGVWVDADGNEADAITASLCPILFSDLLSEDADPMETIMDSLGTNTLGEIMGYELNDSGKWVDSNGNEADALFQAICGVLLEDLMDSEAENNAIIEAFGDSGTTLGGLMGYELVDGEWVDSNGEPADSLFAALCGIELYELMKDGADPADEIMSALDGTTLGEIMGYELNDSGEWVDANGEPADALFAALCSVNLYHLMCPEESDDPEVSTASDVIMNAFRDSETSLGDIMGYTKEGDKWYVTDNGVKTEVTGVGAIVAGYLLYDIMNDGLDTDEIMSDLTIAKVYNLERVEGMPVYLDSVLLDGFTFGVWFDGDSPASAIISALAGYNVDELNTKIDTLKIADVIGLVEYDGEYYKWTVVGGKNGYITLELDDSLTSEFASLSLKSFQGSAAPGEPTIDSTIQNIEISKVLGYTKIDGKWYKDGVEITGVMASIANSKVGSLTDDIDTLTIGEVAGYTYDDVTDKWVKYENGVKVEATGIIGAFADLTIKQMTNESELSGIIQDVEVGTLLGYEYNETDGKWYSGGEEVKGITGAIAGFTVSGLDSGINTLEVGKLLGYAKTADGWVDENGNKVSGIMGSIAGAEVGNLTAHVEQLKIGEIAGYTYDTELKKWFKEENGQQVAASGIIGAFADLTIEQMTNESALSDKIQGVEVGTLLGYEYNETDGKWYSGVQEVKGITGAIAGFTVAGLDDGINSLKIGELLGYTETSDGWVDGNGNKVAGIMASVSGFTVDSLATDIETLKIGEIMGYYYNSADGKWYHAKNGNTYSDKVTGIMGAIAGFSSSNLEDGINDIQFGEVVGYEKTADGWYSADGTAASGIIKALADLKIDDLKNESVLAEKLQRVNIGDIMGYHYNSADGKWYHNKNGNVYSNEVTGIMGVIAGTKSGNIETKIQNTELGELLNYQKVNGKWAKDSNGYSLHVLMCKIAGYKLNELGNITNQLTLRDLFTDAELSSGYLSLLNPDTTLPNLPSEINSIFTNTTMGAFEEKGIITGVPDAVKGLTIQGLIDYITIFVH